jgi:hypothetical protein
MLRARDAPRIDGGASAAHDAAHHDHRMTSLPAPVDRRPVVLRALALTAFAALIVFGPLSENTAQEKVFAGTLVLLGLLAAAFASGRAAFSLLLVSFVFGAVETAGRLKFLYLQTPVFAPDLQYFVNEGTIEVISHYPLLLAVSAGAIVLLPLLLVLASGAKGRPCCRRSDDRCARAHASRVAQRRCCCSRPACNRSGRSRRCSTSRCGSPSTTGASSPTSSPRSTTPRSSSRPARRTSTARCRGS